MAIKNLFARGIGFNGGEIKWVVTRGFGIGAAPSVPLTLQRLEVWSTFQCASGVRTGFLPVSECQTLITIERTQHDDEGQIVISKQSAAASLIETGNVIRFLYTDGSFTEWIVWTIDDSSRESQVLRISLRSVLTTLDTGRAVLAETVDGVTTVDLEWKALTPASIVDMILAFAPSYWAVGTITPTIPVDLTPSGWMPLRALRELVAAIKAQAVGCELHYRRNSTTGYYVDIVTAIGADEATLDVRTAKNLVGTSRRRDREKHAVEVVPLGTGSPRGTIRDAWWELTAKSTDVLTFQQPVTGGAMLAFNDQLNTARYMVDDTGARIQITDCDASTQQVTVASGTNFTVGRWYRVVNDSAGTEMVTLQKAAGTAGAVRLVESSALDGTTNLSLNPAMREWSGSLPDDWTKSANGTATKITTPGLWVYGGQSLRLQGTAGTSSIESPRHSIYVPTWATTVMYSVWFRIVNFSGSPDIRARRDGVSVGALFAAGTGSVSWINTWRRHDLAVDTSAVTGAVHDFSVFYENTTGGAGSDVYIDAVQIAFSDTATEFVEGSNPAKLWALGNQYLATYNGVPTSYGVTFADLGRWDPTGFPYDVIALGQSARVTDSDLGVTTTGRIIELRRDWKNPLASQLTVTTRPEEFVSLLTGIAA